MGWLPSVALGFDGVLLRVGLEGGGVGGATLGQALSKRGVWMGEKDGLEAPC